MSNADDGDRPVTQAELADLRTALADLQRENEELKNARTEPERREARAGVREAEADLDAVAASLGISREALDRATAEAKHAERKTELKPILAELLTEIRADEEKEAKRIADEEAAAAAAGDKGDKGDKGGKGGKPKPDPDPANTNGNGKPAPDPDPDAGPERPHFSERRISDLLR